MCVGCGKSREELFEILAREAEAGRARAAARDAAAREEADLQVVDAVERLLIDPRSGELFDPSLVAA